MNEKILGYILLAVGLVTIIFAVVSVFNVFTAKVEPVDLFKLSGVSLDIGSLVGGDLPSEVIAQIQRTGGSTNGEIISPDLINKPLNIFAHLTLMGFLASVGFKVSSLGVMLVRPIKVKLKETSGKSSG